MTPPNAAAVRLTPLEFLRLLWKAVQGWFADRAASHGAAIAYYTLFAMAPVLVIVIAIAGWAFGTEAVRGQIVGQIGGLIGRDGATALEQILVRASEPREGLAASAIGLFGLLLAATGAFLELQAALNNIWRVEADPGKGGLDIKGLLLRRLRSLGSVVSIGFLLLVSLTVTTAINAATGWLETVAPLWPVVIGIVNQVIAIAVTATLFGLLFIVLPDVRLKWRDVAVGAVVTAVLFVVGQRLIGLYLGNSDLASPFGAAGTIAIILVWIYYSTQILLLGAEFTKVWAERKGKKPARRSGTREMAARPT